MGKINRFPAEPLSVLLQDEEIMLKSIWAPYYLGKTADTQTAGLYAHRLQAMNTAFGTKTAVEHIDPNYLTDTIIKNVRAGTEQADYIQGVFDTSVYVVPANKAKSVDKVCAWLEQMAPLEEEILALKANEWKALGLDGQSIAAYENATRNRTAEFSSGVFSASLSAEFDVAQITPTPRDYADPIYQETLRARAQKELDDYYSAFYE